MTSAQWELVTRIFGAALGQPIGARNTFVRQECKGDHGLEADVLKLLAADEQAGSFLDRPALSRPPDPSTLDRTISLFASGSIVSGRFEILRFIGQGGMGQVYEALDLELKGRVALKTIRPDISSDPRVLSRFRREVQLTRRITHPNVCRTFDIDRHTSAAGDGSESDIAFLTMELLEGETLADLLRRQGRLTAMEALPLVLQMIEALGAAHSVGVVHRDFKPSNVLLVASSNGLRVVVTDFGLARVVLPDEQVSTDLPNVQTGSHGLIGTLVYMAPEQFERGEATVASDLYSLGLVIYEMVTGQRPFADPIPFAEAARRIKHPAPSPKLLAPELDPTWEAAICRCLEADPANRFETARAVGDSFSEAQHSMAPTARATVDPLPPFAVTTRSRTSRRRFLTVAACILLLLLSLLSIFLRYYIRRPAPIQFAERDWILVTDFTNQTGERVFDRVVRDLTVQALSQSSYLNIVPRLSALEAAKRTGLKDVNSINDKLGRELCLRENYRALLTGDIFKEGSRYVVAMKVEFPGKDSSTISDSESIQSPDDIFAGVDRLTTRIRRALGESLSRIETNTKPLAHVTTPSLDALQRYSTALDLYGAREYTRSIALANDAVERDPNFAMAHLLLARAYEQMGDENKFRRELHIAGTELDRVGERERHLILAVGYSSQLMNEKAADEYQHLLDIFPDDADALKGYAYEAFWAGHSDQAITAQRKVLTLNPSDAGSYDALMTLLVRTNQFSAALAVYEQAKSHKLESANLRFIAALATWGEGDLSLAQEMLESLSNEGSSYWKIVSRVSVGRLLSFQGRMAEAIGVFRAGLSLVQVPGLENWVPVFQYQIARAVIVKGDIPTARIECKKYRRIAEKAPTAANLQRGVSLSLEVGDLRSARYFQAVAERQVAQSPDPFSEMELHSLRGEIKLTSGHSDEAINEEQSAITFRKWYTPYLYLGQACEATRNWSCSIKAYSQYLDFKGAILRDDAGEDWPIAHYSLAKAYFESGDPNSGSVHYQEFMRLFSAADPDLPILVHAKHEMSLMAGKTEKH